MGRWVVSSRAVRAAAVRRVVRWICCLIVILWCSCGAVESGWVECMPILCVRQSRSDGLGHQFLFRFSCRRHLLMVRIVS